MIDWKTIDFKDYTTIKEMSNRPPRFCFEHLHKLKYTDEKDKQSEFTASCPVGHIDDETYFHGRWGERIEGIPKQVSFYCEKGCSLKDILRAVNFKLKGKWPRKWERERIAENEMKGKNGLHEITQGQNEKLMGGAPAEVKRFNKLRREDRRRRKAAKENFIFPIKPNLPIGDAKLDLKIDEEFHNLIPPISKDEYGQLADNILFEGCRDPIVIWNGIIIDGHNRYEICQKHGIEFKTLEKSFDSRDEAKIWIIRNQLGRRNISDYDRANLALELKPMMALRAKERQRKSGGAVPQKSAEPPIDTREELAKIAGVSHDTIHKVDTIKKKGSEGIKEAARRGKISINKAYKATRKSKEKKQKEKKSKEEGKTEKLGPPSNGMQFARIAILNLEKITDDDLERDEAMAFVKQWIKNHERR